MASTSLTRALLNFPVSGPGETGPEGLLSVPAILTRPIFAEALIPSSDLA
jgi:hypothetical protein